MLKTVYYHTVTTIDCICRAADAIRQLGITWDAQDERTPVLAIGSNAGPEQLLRKYPPDMFPGGVLIPCMRCMLADFDVAFAPLISSYGSCTGEHITAAWKPQYSHNLFAMTTPQESSAGAHYVAVVVSACRFMWRGTDSQ